LGSGENKSPPANRGTVNIGSTIFIYD